MGYTSSNILTGVDYTKEEFIAELQKLNGGSDSSVPDFLFFTHDSLETYANTKGPPRNRTEKRRPNRPHPPTRSPADKTLSRATDDLRKGKNVNVITKWARILDILIFNQGNKIVPTNKECVALKMVGFDTSTICSSSSSSSNKNKKNRKKGRKRKKRRLQEESISAEKKQRLLDYLIGRRSPRKDYEEGEGEEDEKDEEGDNVMDIFNNDDQYNDDDRDIDDGGESFRDRFQIDIPAYHPRQRKHINHNLKARSPIQTIDYDRMRRSLSYRYSETGECYAEGSVGTTDDTILLCETCYRTVDFGYDV